VTILDPTTGENVEIVGYPEFLRRLCKKQAQRKAQEFADAAKDGQLSKHIYPQSDSGDETSHEGC
jgi:hypothetical protein